MTKWLRTTDLESQKLLQPKISRTFLRIFHLFAWKLKCEDVGKGAAKEIRYLIFGTMLTVRRFVIVCLFVRPKACDCVYIATSWHNRC